MLGEFGKYYYYHYHVSLDVDEVLRSTWEAELKWRVAEQACSPICIRGCHNMPIEAELKRGVTRGRGVKRAGQWRCLTAELVRCACANS